MSPNPTIVRLSLAGAVFLLCAGCGQKGPLFMESPPPAAAKVAPEQEVQDSAEERSISAEDAAGEQPATTLEMREQLDGG